ncbi:hypothetical protein IWT140_01723 [Secundilactobacillus pentosiphilus]|uniref:Uncharacterized protein n=1 Tax=Secundilactobacillus pentosiphilus TaxID=1714682 RepID=A0A1Z5IQY5_9LACO|nr:hypothetical protein IWT140_01723 [Secundilactobacillus pentosiphilus]
MTGENRLVLPFRCSSTGYFTSICMVVFNVTRIINDKDYGKAYGMELKCLRELEHDLSIKKAEQPVHKFKKYTKAIRINERD